MLTSKLAIKNQELWTNRINLLISSPSLQFSTLKVGGPMKLTLMTEITEPEILRISTASFMIRIKTGRLNITTNDASENQNMVYHRQSLVTKIRSKTVLLTMSTGQVRSQTIPTPHGNKKTWHTPTIEFVVYSASTKQLKNFKPSLGSSHRSRNWLKRKVKQ